MQKATLCSLLLFLAMKKILICCFVLGLFSQCKSEVQKTATKPNVVLLVGDDQGYPYFGFMGADYVKTPHMDRLADQSFVFTQGYVPQNHCRPSLATLITGQTPTVYESAVEQLIQDRGIDTPKDKQEFRFQAMQYFNSLPKVLADAGYVSFQGGKWWEFHYKNGGFTHGMTEGWTPEDRKNGSKWFKQFMGGQGLELARATMEPVYDFIDEHEKEPFFIWYAPELPHYPFDAPDRYYNIYKNTDFSESAKRYYANCTWFDEGVGELKAYLGEKQLLDNTIFIYVNDNGWEQGPYQEFRNDSLRWHNGGDKGKLSVYDQSFRTPILFSWPKQIKPGSSEALVHSADIPYTILDLLGLEQPQSFEGQTLRPIWENPSVAIGRSKIIGKATQIRDEADMMGKKIEAYWVRDQDWFFRWNLTLDEKALFDMKNDPNNDYDLVQKYPERVEEYIETIENWKKNPTLVD